MHLKRGHSAAPPRLAIPVRESQGNGERRHLFIGTVHDAGLGLGGRLRAGGVGCYVRDRLNVQQFFDFLQARSMSRRQKAVVSHFNKTVRQNMLQEAPDKFFRQASSGTCANSSGFFFSALWNLARNIPTCGTVGLIARAITGLTGSKMIIFIITDSIMKPEGPVFLSR